ncbi:MAG: hypothetical protein WA854_03240 [Candidatus Binataceae bacterium]
MAAKMGVLQRISHPKPGTYSDGHPLDEVHYLECKLILKPDRFIAPPSFHDYAKIVRRAAEENDIDFSTSGFKKLTPKIREVVFLDTRDFALYNHAFILRRRIAYEDGFPVGEPEVVFKFRHPDFDTAAQLDVRPNIRGEYRIKFKAEALPLKDKLGGYRMLFSHNVEFGLDQARGVDSASLATLVNLFPLLATLKKSGAQKIELVNHEIVEEVLQDLGELDFGKGVTAKCNAALWRQRGDHKLLVGEFSYECKFKRGSELHEKAMERCKRFFVSLQQIGKEWVSLGTTKTGIVYRLKGNPPQAHE